MNSIIKGFKTSELYVVAAVLFPGIFDSLSPIFQMFGLDIPMPTTDGQVVELAKQLRDIGVSTTGAYWVAGAYVVSRFLLKWRAEGK